MNFNDYVVSEMLTKSEEKIANKAWGECKSNVLNILRQNYRYDCSNKFGRFVDVIDEKVVKEIEKL